MAFHSELSKSNLLFSDVYPFKICSCSPPHPLKKSCASHVCSASGDGSVSSLGRWPHRRCFFFCRMLTLWWAVKYNKCTSGDCCILQWSLCTTDQLYSWLNGLKWLYCNSYKLAPMWRVQNECSLSSLLIKYSLISDNIGGKKKKSIQSDPPIIHLLVHSFWELIATGHLKISKGTSMKMFLVR